MVRWMLGGLMLAAVWGAGWAGAAMAAARPNFLVIVADDMGFSDLGAFGGEIPTPNLDRLALAGIRFTGFHTSPTCSPTRSMLLSGTDNHRAGLGSMAELLVPNQIGKPGYEGHLRPDIATLAEQLSVGGYRTLMAGKWHLGLAPEQDPHARGFEHSFALLQGAANHFGKDIATDPRAGAVYRENGQTLATLPADFYSSDSYASKLIAQLAASRDGRPFFAYLAFTAPHWPLQAPAETIARYRGHYDAGYEALRAERLKRQVALGLVPADAAEHPLENAPRWASLSSEQKRAASRMMEIYAAMVDRMDENVGRVIAALKASGDYDNTIILFLSDNGAEGLDVAASRLPVFRAFVGRADNSYESLGGPRSYISYGPGWAQAADTPSWLYKSFETEGGTRTPAFLTGPIVRSPGTIAPLYLNVMDIAPTLLDLAGITPASGTFQGRAVQPMLGASWKPWLAGAAGHVHAPTKPMGAELFGSRALRQGDWKLTDPGDGRWRLFNIARDPGETRDLSAAEPNRRAQLEKAWDAYARTVGVILPEPPVVIE